ncbi:polysaccharide deacetylase family protein [Paenibacillus lacisoli]|nr:polysaccharide deacetylase family protein [Paenibacillus sp. JX-17]
MHGPRTRQVALTFDDVPDPRFTPQILDILSRYHIRGTFFVVGNRAHKHQALTTRIAREGHVVGNHSFSHPNFKKKTVNTFRTQILQTENELDSIIGYRPRLIRTPYGEINEQQVRWARARGYKVVNWNVDSMDWSGIGKEQVKHNILNNVGPGSIILMHAGGGVGSDLSGGIQALPEIIMELKHRGYQLVTLPEMLKVQQEK